MVSIITCTMRPALMENVFDNYLRQNVEKKELLIVLNRNDMDIDKWKSKAEPFRDIAIHQLPEENTLGKCLNFAIAKAKYDIIAKFDDDDYYAPNYFPEVLVALNETGAAIVGKSAAFIYFAENKSLMLFRGQNENSFQNDVKGGTLVFKKNVWDTVKFSENRICGSDSQFLRESSQHGFKIYSVSKYNYACVRNQDISQHTQKVSTKDYMARCQFICCTDDYIPIVTR